MMLRLSHRILAVAALCAGVLPAHGNDFASARTSLEDAMKGGRYVPRAAAEIQRAEDLFLRLARGCNSDEVAADARALALDVRAEGPLVIVRERDDAKWGRGFFVFRRGARPDVLQVPHGGTDKLTEKI